MILEKIIQLKCRCFFSNYNSENKTNLTSSEFRGLQCLRYSDGISALEFSEKIGLSPSRSSRVIEKMINEGLVKSIKSKHDKRKVELYVTNKGNDLNSDIRAISDDLVRRIEEKYGKEGVGEVTRGLDILLDVIE